MCFAKLAFTPIVFYSMVMALSLISIILKIINIMVCNSSPLAILPMCLASSARCDSSDRSQYRGNVYIVGVCVATGRLYVVCTEPLGGLIAPVRKINLPGAFWMLPAISAARL